MLSAVLAVVALLVLLVVWQWAQKRDAMGPLEVKASPAGVGRAMTASEPASAPVMAAAVPAGGATQLKPSRQSASGASAGTGAAVAVAADAPSTATNSTEGYAPQSQDSNAPAMTPPPPPKPAPLRLQAIVFNPSRPSAMVSGKTLFIGDKLGEFRVVAIDQESATLVGGGQTNVLSLPE
jgi:hypothetical protein